MAAAKPNHDYHILPPDPWPLIGAFSALALTGGGVMWMHDNPYGKFVFVIGLVAVLTTMFNWWSNTVKEAHAGDQIGAAWWRGGRAGSRRRRAAGASSSPSGPGSTYQSRGQPADAWQRQRWLVGLVNLHGWRRCGSAGSTRPTCRPSRSWHGRCRRLPSRRRRPCRSASISRPRHSGAASATCPRACRCSGA